MIHFFSSNSARNWTTMMKRIGARMSPYFTPATKSISALYLPTHISILKVLYNFLITLIRYNGIPNFSRIRNSNSWWIESKALIKSAYITQDSRSCSLRIYNKVRREQDPSRHPDSRHDPNCRGVPNFPRVECRRLVIAIETALDTTSSKLIPLQLFGLDKYNLLLIF